MTSNTHRFLSALLCVLGGITTILLGVSNLIDKRVILVPVAFIIAGLVLGNRTPEPGPDED